MLLCATYTAGTLGTFYAGEETNSNYVMRARKYTNYAYAHCAIARPRFRVAQMSRATC